MVNVCLQLLTLLYDYGGCFTICIRSIHTGSVDYVLQFIWDKRGDDKFLLDSIVAAMKRHLPTFKVSSGVELGEELSIQLISDSMNDELGSFEICIPIKATPRPEFFEREGEAVQLDLPIQQLIAEDATQNGELVQPDSLHNQSDGSTRVLVSEGEVAQVDVSVEQRSTTTSLQQSCITKRYSTDPIPLSREDIEQHYGKTQKEAAESLKGSCPYKTSKNESKNGKPSISKEKLMQCFGMKIDAAAESLEAFVQRLWDPKWPRQRKKKVRRSVSKHSLLNEFVQGNEKPISESSLKNSDSLQDQAPVANAYQIPNVTTMQGTGMATVRATFQDYILKFQISFSATRADLLCKVTERLSLEGGSLSMEYRDEDNEYILIGCDADMSRCMGSLTSSGKTTADVRIKLIASEILPSLFKSSPDLTENGGNKKQKLINKLKDDIEVKEESKKRKKAIVKEEVNKVIDVTSTGREDVQENVENIGTHPLSCDDGQRRKVLEQFIFDQTRDPKEILVETGTEFLSCKQIRKLLTPTAWIDDDVINTAVSMLTAEEERRQQSNPQLRRSWFLPTYVYEKLRMDKHDFGSIWSDFRRYMGDVSVCNKIFILINEMNRHWYMCRIDLMNGVIELLDSLPDNKLSSSRLDEVTKLRDLFAELLYYIGATTYGAKVRRLPIKSPKWVPNQRNGCDCGLFIIKFMREEYGPHSVPANGEGHDSITERVKLAVFMVLHETNIHREKILQQVQPF